MCMCGFYPFFRSLVYPLSQVRDIVIAVGLLPAAVLYLVLLVPCTVHKRTMAFLPAFEEGACRFGKPLS